MVSKMKEKLGLSVRGLVRLEDKKLSCSEIERGLWLHKGRKRKAKWRMYRGSAFAKQCSEIGRWAYVLQGTVGNDTLMRHMPRFHTPVFVFLLLRELMCVPVCMCLRVRAVRALLRPQANLNRYEEASSCYLQALRLNPEAKHIW